MEERKKELLKISKMKTVDFTIIIRKIIDGYFDDLDIKKLSGSELYRCRVGRYRIIFKKNKQGTKIIKLGNRGDIYKNL